MKKTIVFCHGFASSPSVFNGLKAYLKGFDFIDWNLGYETLPSFQTHKNAYAIGHSLGFYKLLEKQSDFKAIVGLGGFVDFICCSKKREQALEKLIQKFHFCFSQGLDLFSQMSHMPLIQSESCQQNVLMDDLYLLKNMPIIKTQIPHLVIGAQDDPIVSKDVLKRSFLDHSIKWFPDGGHLFFHKYAQETAQIITKFIEQYQNDS